MLGRRDLSWSPDAHGPSKSLAGVVLFHPMVGWLAMDRPDDLWVRDGSQGQAEATESRQRHVSQQTEEKSAGATTELTAIGPGTGNGKQYPAPDVLYFNKGEDSIPWSD
jgi:hypothetical protein